MSYHGPAIAVFKTMATGRYSASDRSWSFGMSDHDALARQLRDLPDVQLDALPTYVTKTFLKNSKAPPIERRKSINNSGTEGEEPLIEPSLWDSLMPFQRDGVRYGLERNGNLLLADDMGLGKTLQSLAIASAYSAKWPLLVVCPSSMRFSWKSSVIRWLPSVPEEEVRVVTTGADDVEDYRVVIISYDLVSKKEFDLKQCQFRVAIIDESHTLKNYKSQRCKSVTAVLGEACQHAVLLSGTPALSRPIELYTQICLIDDKLFPFVTDFGMRYCDGRKVNYGGPKDHYDFSGSSNMHELKLLMEEKFMLRRLKSDVLSQLPSKQRQMVILDPNLVKSRVTKQMKSQQKEMSKVKGGEQRGLLLEWFHSTADAKKVAVKEYLKDMIESGTKFLCFAHHQTMLGMIETLLQEKKVGYIKIDGHTGSEKRKELCDQFQTSDAKRVALLSITAASTGLTLTSAQLVLFAELFWNPGILTQAEDRAHRIGQTDSVIVRYLVATGTADDHLWTLISQKLDVLNKAGLSKDNFMDKDSGENIKQVTGGKGKITSHFTPSPAATSKTGKAHSTKVVEAKASKECLRVSSTVNLERELEGISWEDSDFDEESLAQVERGVEKTLDSVQAGTEKSTGGGSPVTEPGADSTFDTFDDHELALLDGCDEEQPSSKKPRI